MKTHRRIMPQSVAATFVAMAVCTSMIGCQATPAESARTVFEKQLTNGRSVKVVKRSCSLRDVPTEFKSYVAFLQNNIDPRISDHALEFADIAMKDAGHEKSLGMIVARPSEYVVLEPPDIEILDTEFFEGCFWLIYASGNQVNLACFSEERGMIAAKAICQFRDPNIGYHISGATLTQETADPAHPIAINLKWWDIGTDKESIFSAKIDHGTFILKQEKGDPLPASLERLNYEPQPPYGLPKLPGHNRNATA